MQKVRIPAEAVNSSFLKLVPAKPEPAINPYLGMALDMAANNVAAAKNPRGSSFASIPMFGGELEALATNGLNNGQSYKGLQWTKRF